MKRYNRRSNSARKKDPGRNARCETTCDPLTADAISSARTRQSWRPIVDDAMRSVAIGSACAVIIYHLAATWHWPVPHTLAALGGALASVVMLAAYMAPYRSALNGRRFASKVKKLSAYLAAAAAGAGITYFVMSAVASSQAPTSPPPAVRSSPSQCTPVGAVDGSAHATQ